MGAVSGLLVGRSGTVLEARSTLTICEPSACGANSTIRKFRIVQIEGIVANRNATRYSMCIGGEALRFPSHFRP
jgi:hypothetical protein